MLGNTFKCSPLWPRSIIPQDPFLFAGHVRDNLDPFGISEVDGSAHLLGPGLLGWPKELRELGCVVRVPIYRGSCVCVCHGCHTEARIKKIKKVYNQVGSDGLSYYCKTCNSQ